MFGRKPKVDALKLKEAKIEILDRMLTTDPGSEEYSTLLQQLTEVSKLENPESSRQIDYNTMLTVGGHLLGVLIIVGYERANVMTSKAKDFALKLK